MTETEAARRIGVLTTGRQDWGILRTACIAIDACPELDLELIVGGMHLDPTFGHTVDEVRADGFTPSREVAWDPGRPAWEQLATVAHGVGVALADGRPDALLLVGDRFETAAAALAATTVAVPIAHLHGGEETQGAFDDQLRHAITKLSHLHLVASDAAAARVVALGEDPRAIRLVGPPGTDAAFRDDLPDRAELEASLGVDLRPPVVLVSVHPTTLATDPTADARTVASALDAVDATYVISLPNADPGGEAVRSTLRSAAAHDPRRVAVEALGQRRHWGLLRLADALVGNSSSGIIEAPLVGLPVVNVGDRQRGRERWGPVVDVEAEGRAIAAALAAALRDGRHGPAERPLVDGHAGERVALALAGWHPTRPPRKPPISG
ncbi:MAG TPA: UDP-N-acetylglucosamine 2-epimerase [Candidatus Limnocylindrales bacterium]